jgi:hypothetical protein
MAIGPIILICRIHRSPAPGDRAPDLRIRAGIIAIGAAPAVLDPALLSRNGKTCAHCGAPDRGVPPVITRFVRVVVLSTMSALVALQPAAARAQSAPCPQEAPPASAEAAPSNVTVDDLLQPLVAVLLERSAFFKQQWATINASRVTRVAVRARTGMQDESLARARAQISRYAYGSLRATIEIPAGVDLTELLPHELEHVIEQIEGIDLPALARRRGEGVVELRRGVFETERARTAGRRVLDEVYAGTDPGVGAALGGLGRVWRALTPGTSGRTSPAGRPAVGNPVRPRPAPGSPARSPLHKH